VAYPVKADVGSAKFSDTTALEAVGEPITWKTPRAATKRADGTPKPKQGLDRWS
jgi:hypothetical protein